MNSCCAPTTATATATATLLSRKKVGSFGQNFTFTSTSDSYHGRRSGSGGGLHCANPSPSSKFRTRAAVEDGLMGSSSRSFYELLGISEAGSFKEIKRAYKQMARRYHPDVCPPDRAEEYTRRFIEVQEAYETLSDPNSRAMYDLDLARGLHLAFSARRRCGEGFEEKSEWRNQWQNQIDLLRRRSMYNDSDENMSWGSRMRRQRAASPAMV